MSQEICGLRMPEIELGLAQCSSDKTHGALTRKLNVEWTNVDCPERMNRISHCEHGWFFELGSLVLIVAQVSA